jgi:hypothetical protein
MRLAVSVVVAVAALVAAGGRSTVVPACRGSDLGGVFVVVRGSAGAGGISYTLRLHNRSSAACFVSGIPGLRLLGRTGAPLSTHVRPSHPGALTAVRVVLRPGGFAAATARFSPDIPGPGEPQTKQCEPTAYYLKVSPAGRGSVVLPVSPPTPVCEHGQLFMSALVAGRRGPIS